MLSSVQLELLRLLRSAVADDPSRPVVYCTEYLGYLPFGMYHWFEISGQDNLSFGLPDFSSRDLDALVAAGRLRRVSQFQNADDELESRTTYHVLGD